MFPVYERPYTVPNRIHNFKSIFRLLEWSQALPSVPASRSRNRAANQHKFYFDTMCKRNLSNKQCEKRIQINDKVLRQVARNRLGR
jgi:hypothetical protein